jgi:hypothetical protein
MCVRVCISETRVLRFLKVNVKRSAVSNEPRTYGHARTHMHVQTTDGTPCFFFFFALLLVVLEGLVLRAGLLLGLLALANALAGGSAFLLAAR